MTRLLSLAFITLAAASSAAASSTGSAGNPAGEEAPPQATTPLPQSLLSLVGQGTLHAVRERPSAVPLPPTVQARLSAMGRVCPLDQCSVQAGIF